MSDKSQSPALDVQARLFVPCENRAVIFEAASLFLLFASVALIAVQIWPGAQIEREFRSYFQLEYYTRSLENDVDTIMIVIRCAVFATILYLLRLMFSLYVFDSIRIYCIQTLSGTKRLVGFLEWLLRLGVVIYFLWGVNAILNGHQFYFLFIIENGIKIENMNSISSPIVGFPEIRGLMNVIAFLSGALLMLLIWTALVVGNALVRSEHSRSRRVAGLLGRFLIGPVINLAIFHFVLKLLNDPEIVVVEPNRVWPVYLLCGFQILYAVSGISGVRIVVTDWKKCSFQIGKVPGYLEQFVSVLRRNAQRAFSRTGRCAVP